MSARLNPITGKPYRPKGEVDPLKMRWVEDAGSVFTEEPVETKSDAGAYVVARIIIVFNVGPELARHIVSLHNQSLPAERGTNDLGRS